MVRFRSVTGSAPDVLRIGTARGATVADEHAAMGAFSAAPVPAMRATSRPSDHPNASPAGRCPVSDA
ncbi:hypothetical protein H074_33324 [Amycolatopsis decaplanina DSM 44594]|uniref:Uncharacterized protein n=1 Tax=Amycolatopsis decaplanina DSM 44594 TaxID=1284240 RepID=M2XTJ5_9PSEU|nr:hypothetical protein H074_33324 [Amycolatopsis decaplanina DSM 44594]